MGDLTSIQGRAKKEELCLYCGRVPASKHPGLSCPRIHAVSFDDEMGVNGIRFVDPEEWAVLLAAVDGTGSCEDAEEDDA
jgi:hypothetical protein